MISGGERHQGEAGRTGGELHAAPSSSQGLMSGHYLAIMPYAVAPAEPSCPAVHGRAPVALGSPGHRLDRRQVRRPPCTRAPARSCRPSGRAAERARRAADAFGAPRARLLRGARRRPRGRRRLRRDAAPPPPAARPARHRGRQARARREAGRARCRGGAADRGGRRPAPGSSAWRPCGRSSCPRFDVVRQLLEDGWLGEPRRRARRHGEWFDDGHRIMRADLAGGPMLDLGTYPVTLATWVLGRARRGGRRRDPRPERHQRPARHRADHGRRGVASLVTMLADTPTAASITGGLGRIDLGGPVLPARTGGLSLRTATDCPGTSRGSATPPCTSRRPRWRAGSRRRDRLTPAAVGRHGGDPRGHGPGAGRGRHRLRRGGGRAGGRGRLGSRRGPKSCVQ